MFRVLLAALALSACVPSMPRIDAESITESSKAQKVAALAASSSAAVFASEHAYADSFVGSSVLFSDSLHKLTRSLTRLTPLGEQQGYAFIHHKMLARGVTGSSGGGGSWSNVKSCKYGGTATASAARTNWGQPSAWCTNPAANAYSFSFWFKRRGDDGALLTSADQSSNSHMRIGVASTALNNVYAGGNFVSATCATTITDNTWYLLSWVYDGAGNLNVYVGNSSTACITYNNVGTNVCTRDFIFNTLRSANNTDTAFGEWGLHNLDEFTVWNTALTGTDHVNLQSAGHAIDPSTHSKAANLINYYRCGDHASDSTTNLQDVVGSANGTHSGSDGVTYPSDVP